MDDFEYVTSGAAVKITANNITDYKNDAESCSFKASLEGYEKNGESYELKDTQEFTYSKPKETVTFTRGAYGISPQGSGEWVNNAWNESFTTVGDTVHIYNESQKIRLLFKLLDAENKTVSVLGNGMTDNDSIADGSVDLDIPETITCNGTEYAITEISDDAFVSCEKLSKVTVPDSVERIEERVFNNCINITDLTLPKELKRVGNNAFQNCTSLIRTNYPKISEYTGECIFQNCKKLESVKVEEGVTSIGDRAFVACGALTSVELPEGLESIGDSAFLGCGALTSVELSESLESIGESAFSDCGALKSVELPKSLESIRDDAFSGCRALISVELPEGLESIGDGAFFGCGALTSVELPESLESIGDRAFAVCRALISVELPESLKSIGYGAFFECNNLKYMNLPNGLDSNSKMGIPTMILISKDCNSDIKDYIDNSHYDNEMFGKLEYQHKILGLKLDKGSKEISSYKENISYENVLEHDISSTEFNVKLEIISENNDNIAEATYDKANNKVTIAATGKGNGIVKVKITAQETVNGESYEFYKIREVKISNNDIRILLSDKYDETSNLSQNNYTEESFNELKEAINNAKIVINNNTTLDKDMENAYNALNNSIDSLVYISEIKKLYADVKDIVKGNYTDETYSKFKTALNNAETIINKKDANKSEVTAAEKILQDAVSGLKVKSSSGGSSSGGRSSSEAKPIITVGGKEIKAVILSKEAYGSSVIGNTLAPIGLNLSELDSLYEINSDDFKGNVAKLTKTIENADGTKSETHYVYVKCESGEKFKVDTSSLNKDVPVYVYKIDNLGNTSLVETLDSNTVKNNGYAVDVNSEAGSNYVISEEKIAIASNTSTPAVKTGWNLLDGKWHEVLADGSYAKGWYKDLDGSWYMLDRTTGAMATGWFKDTDGEWYYLDGKSGKMVTGWLKDMDGKWYYLGYNGAMARNTIINGYRVDESGKWVN